MCDFIIAGDSAKFGQPEINLGIGPGMGGTQRLTKLIGRSKAMYMCLTGELMNAQQAEIAGLVAKVYPADELLPNALQMAATIASKGLLATIMVKEAVNAAEELSLTERLRLERRMFQTLFGTADQKEGMKAFLEKRKPVFTNQ
jgi:enoyl-CoA hydratase/carnithine racemase